MRGSSVTPPIKPGARITAGSDLGVSHDTFARSTDPDYEFYGSISEEMLHRYLDRSITMARMANINDAERLASPPSYHSMAMAMLHDIRPKFIKRLAGVWDRFESIETILTNLKNDIAYIHANIDSQIICEGATFENIDTSINEIDFPTTLTDPNGNNILELFGQTAIPHEPNFVYENMQYDRPFPPGITDNIPDISKVETRMWVYYLATRFIDCGCEAIHFGQTGLMNLRDPGNKHYWDLVQKIRAFARTRNRGIIICSGGKDFYERTARDRWLPVWEQKLIFDFNSLGVYYSRPSWFTCTIDPPYATPFILHICNRAQAC